MGFFDKIKQGLTKTRDALSNTLGNVFTASEIDDDFYDELEESLILADLGVETSVKAAELLNVIRPMGRICFPAQPVQPRPSPSSQATSSPSSHQAAPCARGS